MFGISLLFIGSVLLVNGIGLTGRLESKETAPLNLIVGLLVLIINLIGLYRAENINDYFSVAGGFLFCFTYLYLSIIQWYKLKGDGLGWYCLFVALSALVFATLSDDYRLIIMWLLWSSLWFLFFISLSFNKNIKSLAYYTILIGVSTCWLPGLLMLTSYW
ncbi:AmiS/UreI transporter [Acinetobacter sp. ANC 4558]|uniref:AmiS/UreI family transporter n=1 Tax=Acinetobacter sp. ANC 4558 TaxID=1977876 RepID=UPI000A33A79E|nr:AmiS/UreI family transporter [Acinetobacter sp. ANC 4558]OTG86120.1 AmiS/UreI transporter [Acinetobacter sp. ANC 4558]